MVGDAHILVSGPLPSAAEPRIEHPLLVATPSPIGEEVQFYVLQMDHARARGELGGNEYGVQRKITHRDF